MDLPKGISIINLVNVNISNCELKIFPTELTKIPSLKTLNVSNNNIEYLPDNIGVLKNLN